MGVKDSGEFQRDDGPVVPVRQEWVGLPLLSGPRPASSRWVVSTQVLHGNACSEHVLGPRPSSKAVDKCDCDEYFSRLFREHVGRVYAYALRHLRSSEDAEDLVAEVFLAAWREAENLPRRPLAWLLVVARRRLVDAWRLARREQRLLLRLEQERPTGPTTGPCSPTDAPEERPALGALALLDEPDREALILVYWDGLSGRQAARVMGLNPAAFRMRLGRARRRLARALGDQFGM